MRCIAVAVDIAVQTRRRRTRRQSFVYVAMSSAYHGSAAGSAFATFDGEAMRRPEVSIVSEGAEEEAA